MTPATANTSADFKLAAKHALGALASLLSIVYGFALIAAVIFGGYAFLVALVTEELPPVMVDNPFMVTFLFVGTAWALLQHWVADTKLHAAEKRLKTQIRAELPAMIRHAAEDAQARGRTWPS